MRVALVTSLVSPLRRRAANGPHAVVLDLARGLGRRGHEVRVYAAEGSDAEGIELVGVPVEPDAARAAVRFGQSAPPGAVAALNRSFERLFALLERDAPDVVSQHAFDARPIELSEALPTLHTLHLPPSDPSIVAAARSTAGALATVSSAARVDWEAATGREVPVIRNGVRDLALPPGGPLPIALIAGRIAPEKGTDVAIRAARRAGLAVLVAGDVYDPEYHAASVEPSLRPGEWVGAVTREELSALMARCAVTIMPVRWDEAFGLVAAEAQMAGCPVVAYRRGALPEVVPHGVGGWLVEPDHEEALASAIHMARGLDRAAIRRRAQRELGVERMVDGYERALTALAAERRLLAAS